MLSILKLCLIFWSVFGFIKVVLFLLSFSEIRKLTVLRSNASLLFLLVFGSMFVMLLSPILLLKERRNFFVLYKAEEILKDSGKISK